MKPTPTTNARLRFRLSGFGTLAEGLDYAARGETGCNFFSARGELQQVLPYRDLRARARDLAARLAGLDFARGSRAAIIDHLIGSFERRYGLTPGQVTPDERAEAEELVRTRFGTREWVYALP